MRVQGSYTFDTDVKTVWDAMQSPDVLSGCIPGCESFDPAGENRYTVRMSVRVSAITGSYQGEVRIENSDYLNSYTMIVQGSGRGGTVKGVRRPELLRVRRPNDHPNSRRRPGHRRHRKGRAATARRRVPHDDEPVLRLPQDQNRVRLSLSPFQRLQG